MPRLALPILAVAGLAGCTAAEGFPPPCPSLALLKNGADLTRFDPRGRDVTDLLVTARITEVPAKCTRVGADKIKATLSVSVDVQRGPASTAPNADITYFVSVLDGDQVLDQQDFPLRADFTQGPSRLTVKGDPVELLLPVTPQKSAAAYRVFVGLRLTPEELAWNRQHGVQ